MTRAQRLVERLEKLFTDIQARRVDFKEWGPLHADVILAVSQINLAKANIFLRWHGDDMDKFDY